ncbi:MAG: hypothetical protein V7750_18280 [Sneathiella sp.]
MARIAEIKEEFDIACTAIEELDQALAVESKRIKGSAFDEQRDLNAAEIKRRKSISGTRMELAKAMTELGQNSIDELERSDDIDSLIKEIKAINQQLTDDLDELRIMVEYSEKAARVADGLAKVVATVIKYG